MSHEMDISINTQEMKEHLSNIEEILEAMLTEEQRVKLMAIRKRKRQMEENWNKA